MAQSTQPAIIYVRVSGRRQLKEGNGLKSQEQRCRQYAKMKGYSVIAVFREQAKTGGMKIRPEMTELMTFLDSQRGQVVVIVDDPKRWARDVIIHFSLKDEIIKRGARLESPSFLFQDTPIGRYTETVYAAGAELERNQNREQVLNRMQARLEMGFWPFHAPAGYIWKRHPSFKKVLALGEPKASIVREALEDFASGALSSRTAVARFLVDQGYFAVRPKYPSTSLSHADRILGNILYTGHLEYAPWQVSLRKAHHPALISLATYRRIQERLSDNDKSFRRKDVRPEFVLRNFIACGGCGNRVTASWSTGRRRRYAYYHCSNRNCCRYGQTISATMMEQRFRDFLDTLHCTDEAIAIIRQELIAAWKALATEVEKERSERPRLIKDLEKEIDTLVNRLMDLSNRTAIAAIERRIEELETKRVELEAKTQEIPFAGIDAETAIKVGIRILTAPRLAWEEGSLTTKRVLQEHVLATPIPHDRNTGLGTPNLRLPFLVSSTLSSSHSCLVDLTEETWNQLLQEVIALGLELGADFSDDNYSPVP